MTGRSRPARPTSTRTNRLLSHPEKNTQVVDTLRRKVQMLTSPGLIEAFTRTAEVSIHSVYHGLEGGQKFSVDMLVAVLTHLPIVEIESAVNDAFAATRFRVVLLPANVEELGPTHLLHAAAPVMSSAGRLAEVVALAEADGRIDKDEVRQIETECCRQRETTSRLAEMARKLAS